MALNSMKFNHQLLYLLAILLGSCEQRQEEQVHQKVDTIYRLQTEAIQAKDGNLYSPNNYLRPQSEDDRRVKVLPKVDNPDSLPVIDLN